MHAKHSCSKKKKTTSTSILVHFPFMSKIVLYVELATLCSHKVSQNMGFFNKNPFGGPRFFVPEWGAIDRGDHGSSFRVGGALAWEGHRQGGGGGLSCMPHFFTKIKTHFCQNLFSKIKKNPTKL